MLLTSMQKILLWELAYGWKNCKSSDRLLFFPNSILRDIHEEERKGLFIKNYVMDMQFHGMDIY